MSGSELAVGWATTPPTRVIATRPWQDKSLFQAKLAYLNSIGLRPAPTTMGIYLASKWPQATLLE